MQQTPSRIVSDAEAKLAEHVAAVEVRFSERLAELEQRFADLSVRHRVAVEGTTTASGTRIITTEIDEFCQLLTELRAVRDSKSFTNDGAHSFREWCMKKFGTVFGGFVEENLGYL